MAYTHLTPDQINQAIPLNRIAGESHDEGQPMSMSQAIALAGQYGAVPSRISPGAADPSTDYSGTWAIPTSNGWIPLSRLAGNAMSDSEVFHGGPTPRISDGPPNMVSTVNNPNAITMQGPPQMDAPRYNLPTGAPAPGPGFMQQYGTPVSPATGGSGMQPWMYPPSTSGPGPSAGGPPQASGPRYDFPAAPQSSSAPSAPHGAININITPSANQNGTTDANGWYQPSSQFSLSPTDQAYKDSVYNGTAQARPQAAPYVPSAMMNPSYPFSPNYRNVAPTYGPPEHTMSDVRQWMGWGNGTGTPYSGTYDRPDQTYHPGPGIDPSLVPYDAPIGPPAQQPPANQDSIYPTPGYEGGGATYWLYQFQKMLGLAPGSTADHPIAAGDPNAAKVPTGKTRGMHMDIPRSLVPQKGTLTTLPMQPTPEELGRIALTMRSWLNPAGAAPAGTYIPAYVPPFQEPPPPEQGPPNAPYLQGYGWPNKSPQYLQGYYPSQDNPPRYAPLSEYGPPYGMKGG